MCLLPRVRGEKSGENLKMNIVLTLLCYGALHQVVLATKFSENFHVSFGAENIRYPDLYTGQTVQLGLNNVTGSGFRSRYPYLYGHLSMKIKLVGGNSAGVVTSYYMASTSRRWSELDFEFLGNVSGEPYILQTNVFSEGKGGREQRILLWFDPTAKYHDYGFLWNQELILFLVDDHVIRVFHNAKEVGVPYLEYQPMYIYASIWNGELWATRGGKDRIDWDQQPFLASYTSFNIQDACAVTSNEVSAMHNCYSRLFQSYYGWGPNLVLSSDQIQDLRWIRRTFMVYDYCTDTKRFKNRNPPECALNWP